jgi:hypothetical protein
MADRTKLNVDDAKQSNQLDYFDPRWLPPEDAAFLQNVKINDPEAVPWVIVRLLAKLGMKRYLTARTTARTPENLEEQMIEAYPQDLSWADFDTSSIHECEEVAAALWAIIASEHSDGEALRIFSELGRGANQAELTAERNNTLLWIYDLPPPLGGNIKRLACQVAAANKYAAERRIPKPERFANGSRDAEVVTRQIKGLLERRKKAKG